MDKVGASVPLFRERNERLRQLENPGRAAFASLPLFLLTRSPRLRRLCCERGAESGRLNRSEERLRRVWTEIMRGGGRLSPPPPGNQRIRFSFEFSFSIERSLDPSSRSIRTSGDEKLRTWIHLEQKKFVHALEQITNILTIPRYVPILKIPFSNESMMNRNT